jgi:Arc/MetJ-type ribon-helix-helix transcriptional regulator
MSARTESVTVRLRASELAELDQIAATRDCSRSDALRYAVSETERLRRLLATWEMAALAGLLALGLDAETADRIGDRIRELSTTQAVTGG